MKTVCLLVVASIVLYSAVAFAQTFNVSNAADFQTALTTAQSNSEDDVINVAAGIYNINPALTYSTPNGDSGHTLIIQGAGAGSTVLDGGVTVQIMYINTDTDHNGGDDGGDVTVSGITFRYGANADQGAGCDIETTDAAITMTDNIFSNNTSVYRGGGVYLYSSGSGSITLTNNTFNDNKTTDPYDGAGGGASIYCDSGSLTVSNNTFLNNQSDQGGGGDFYSGTGAIALDSNIFRDNTASGGDAGGGGADVVTRSGEMTLTNNIFSINKVGANDGGGVSVSRFSPGGMITLTNNTFSGNECNDSSWHGGGAAIWQPSTDTTINVYNNIFWENTGLASDGEDLYIGIYASQNIGVNLYNNDFSSSYTADFVTGQSQGFYISHTTGNSYNHGSNIQLDPLFVNSTNGDFHLSVGASPSPCIDMGTNGAPSLPSTDFEGDPRIMPTGGTVDIGADEARVAVAVPAMDGFGMILFILFAGLGSILSIRRRKRAYSKDA